MPRRYAQVSSGRTGGRRARHGDGEREEAGEAAQRRPRRAVERLRAALRRLAAPRRHPLLGLRARRGGQRGREGERRRRCRDDGRRPPILRRRWPRRHAHGRRVGARGSGRGSSVRPEGVPVRRRGVPVPGERPAGRRVRPVEVAPEALRAPEVRRQEVAGGAPGPPAGVRRRLDRAQPVGVHAVHALLRRRRRRSLGAGGAREPHHQAQGLPLLPVPPPQPHGGALPVAVPGPSRRPPPAPPRAQARPLHAPARRHGLQGSPVEGRRRARLQLRSLVEPGPAPAAEGKRLRLDMSVEEAYQRAMDTVHEWVQKEVDGSKTLAVFRTYSPAHNRGTNGGSCAMETLPELNMTGISLGRWPGMLLPAFGGSESSAGARDLRVMNVTLMTAQRRDGHPAVYNVEPSARMPVGQRADCSHWCLPGVPDAWNELLYAMILRRFS
ncbi:uncharacterized protein LOC123429558 isoform X1 [Hordeum vulgare subsp. vulgare]|uniref:uncharacterized protein LOC123429558 isoform X1 n=1 Tax=Hordeum vulgare subsp. vulgare TaxID=112509 RepID=UPI001D1A528C|nr:uncharacterized protein LOC123429558 isoform X1 [Hordeum vulgare subsp. vulgare]